MRHVSIFGYREKTIFGRAIGRHRTTLRRPGGGTATISGHGLTGYRFDVMSSIALRDTAIAARTA